MLLFSLIWVQFVWANLDWYFAQKAFKIFYFFLKKKKSFTIENHPKPGGGAIYWVKLYLFDSILWWAVRSDSGHHAEWNRLAVVSPLHHCIPHRYIRWWWRNPPCPQCGGLHTLEQHLARPPSPPLHGRWESQDGRDPHHVHDWRQWRVLPVPAGRGQHWLEHRGGYIH